MAMVSMLTSTELKDRQIAIAAKANSSFVPALMRASFD
jgi:hypothetical protein